MGEIDDHKRRENIKGMAKLIEYLMCEYKTSSVWRLDIFCVKIRKKYLLRENERNKEYLLREDKENKTSDDQVDYIDASCYPVDDVT